VDEHYDLDWNSLKGQTDPFQTILVDKLRSATMLGIGWLVKNDMKEFVAGAQHGRNVMSQSKNRTMGLFSATQFNLKTESPVGPGSQIDVQPLPTTQ
jgi:hypothetical protein